ncbi:MAG: ABC transporter permease [Actinobacteria bacterium]|nr:ABC transporter permease [Actinomycetota bacterium]
MKNIKNRSFIKKILKKISRNHIVYIGFILIVIFFSILLRDRGFLSFSNLMNILRQTAVISIMAVGMTFAIVAGDIDLSIGATVALSALVTGILLRMQCPTILAVLGGLGVGLIIGLFNGLVTTKGRVPTILVTLGTQSVLVGLARRITNLQTVPIENKNFTFIFGSGNIGKISTLFIWTIIVALIGQLLLKKTAFGRRIQATGGDSNTARFFGISTNNIRMGVLIISSLSASFAGLLYAGRLHSARYTFGQADLLTVIAAVIIGGTALSGGRGSVIGSIIGSLLMGTLNNGLLLAGLAVPEQMIARGIIIIIAIVISLREKVI